MTVRRLILISIVLGVLCSIVAFAEGENTMSGRMPENLYKGELVAYPGPWAFQIPRAGIILVTDQELIDLGDPDKQINMTTGGPADMKSLRQVCEAAKANGDRTLILAFDHFFSQYRPGQGDKPRTLYPDTPEYIQRLAGISKFAAGYGLGLELSLLNPLEIGPGYQAETGESGQWLHYRKGLRDPETGKFSVEMWRQLKWAANKGPVDIADAGVRVFAFTEQGIHGTPYRVVDPNNIVELKTGIEVESLGNRSDRFERIRVHGTGQTDIGKLDRVLVVQVYRVPEMDYFSDQALPYLTKLVDRYADAGIKLNALYSDEAHIQQDWSYFGHHDHGEFALRYVSDGFARKFAGRYGQEYADFAKYMVYFCYGQEDFAKDLSAKEEVMHVFGSSPEDIQRTALFRARYYEMLQDGVTGLFVKAKHHAEERMGYRLEARAHATWAESPTIDYWRTGQENLSRNQYEYTSNFVWSNTVHQAAAACMDYFRWGDFLTGNGNDHAEGGWLDRDYFAQALACSTGLLNEIPYSYAAHWGMPGETSARRTNIVNVFNTSGSPLFGMVQNMQHRQVEVLMLYPLDLVAVEERFGSWMTQYGYADMMTQAKLIECGKVVNGAIELGGRRYTTLVATFEPFPHKGLLPMMKELVEQGGRVIWSGPPPVLDFDGGNALAVWQDLLGVDYTPGQTQGIMAPGRLVAFSGSLAQVPSQTILTDLLVDRIYPVAAREGTEIVATTQNRVVGTHRGTGSKGSVTFLGFRPRDDQSASLGYETRTWFEVLDTLGAYPATGKFEGINDNTEHLSRTTDYLTSHFPNGAVAIARHFRDYEEGWGGGFARDAESDKKILEAHPLPSEEISLKDFKVNGHSVDFEGAGAVTFRTDEMGNLIAFAGSQCDTITVDGKITSFTDQKIGQLAWAPITADRRVPGGAVLQIMVYGTGKVRVPVPGVGKMTLVSEGVTPGSRGAEIPCSIETGTLQFEVTPPSSGRWIYGIPKE